MTVSSIRSPATKRSIIVTLNGKTAIITGASSGIGRAAALLFAKHGANLVLGARRSDRLEQLADEIVAGGGRAAFLAGDVSNEVYAQSLVGLAVDQFGGLDIAFNNAGIIGAAGPLKDMDRQDWQQVIDTNLTGAFLGAKHQIAAMRDGGSIIFTSSFVGHTIGFAGMAAYAASKAGLIGMTQCLAVECGPQAIRVNTLLPGGTKTEMAGDFSDDPAAAETIANFHALRRMAEPEEIAQAALFLASDASSFVTGSAMLADGGNSITKA